VVRPDKVEGILVNLKGYVQKLRRLAALTQEEFLSDFTKVESAKHLFQVSVECCLDVSNHIIASERFRAPKSYAESFEILAEQGIIPKSFVAILRQMVQFRNRLVHLYWEVDAEIIYEILQKNLGDFDTFAKYVLDYVNSQEQK
jgi:uncharacterized protein YutE (UPF0331/DUF86 family)